jgi:hypothetical protein
MKITRKQLRRLILREALLLEQHDPIEGDRLHENAKGYATRHIKDALQRIESYYEEKDRPEKKWAHRAIHLVALILYKANMVRDMVVPLKYASYG